MSLWSLEIPLLAPKRLQEFSPDEYKTYIEGLYFKPEPKRSVPKKKALKDFKVRAKIKKKGGLSLVTKRNPKYITQEEFSAILTKLSLKQDELFLWLKETGFLIATHEEAERIAKQIKDIPS